MARSHPPGRRAPSAPKDSRGRAPRCLDRRSRGPGAPSATATVSAHSAQASAGCSGAWRAGSGHRASAILCGCARAASARKRLWRASGKRYGSARGWKPAGACPVRHVAVSPNGPRRPTRRRSRQAHRGRLVLRPAPSADRHAALAASSGPALGRAGGRSCGDGALVGPAVRADGRLRCGAAAARGRRRHRRSSGRARPRWRRSARPEPRGRDPVGAELAPGGQCGVTDVRHDRPPWWVPNWEPSILP